MKCAHSCARSRLASVYWIRASTQLFTHIWCAIRFQVPWKWIGLKNFSNQMSTRFCVLYVSACERSIYECYIWDLGNKTKRAQKKTLCLIIVNVMYFGLEQWCVLLVTNRMHLKVCSLRNFHFFYLFIHFTTRDKYPVDWKKTDRHEIIGHE